jgi:hypothetical protein
MKEIYASFNFQILKRNQSLTLFLHQNLQNWLGARFLDLISILMHSEVREINFCVLCFLNFWWHYTHLSQGRWSYFVSIICSYLNVCFC